MKKSVEQRLSSAVERRRTLLTPGGGDTDAFRLVHSDADGFRGLTVDKMGRAILIEAHNKDVDASAHIDAISAYVGPTTPVFFKERWSPTRRGRAGWQVAGPLCHPDFKVRENGAFFWVRLTVEEHIGLFLDARTARQRVMEIASGRRVLNLFSYTGGFGVAAAKGGARSTTNIDNKRSALEIAKKNYQLNSLVHDTRTFLRDDVFRHITRRAKGRGQFDLIVLDPPPTSTGAGKKKFDAKTGYMAIVSKCMKLLSSNGLFLAGINAPGITDARLVQMLAEAALRSDKNIDIIEKIAPGMDFPECRNRPVGQFILFQAT